MTNLSQDIFPSFKVWGMCQSPPMPENLGDETKNVHCRYGSSVKMSFKIYFWSQRDTLGPPGPDLESKTTISLIRSIKLRSSYTLQMAYNGKKIHINIKDMHELILWYISIKINFEKGQAHVTKYFSFICITYIMASRKSVPSGKFKILNKWRWICPWDHPVS